MFKPSILVHSFSGLWSLQLATPETASSSALSPTAAHPCGFDSPASSPAPCSPDGRGQGVHSCYSPPPGQWPTPHCSSFYSSLTLSDSDFDASGCESPAADPISPLSVSGGGVVEHGPYLVHRYARSLGHLMSFMKLCSFWRRCEFCGGSVAVELSCGGSVWSIVFVPAHICVWCPAKMRLEQTGFFWTLLTQGPTH